MQKLSHSQLNYMRCIRSLLAAGTVRSTDISRCMGLSMPSVHHMLVTLEGMGLIEKHRHSVALTDEGAATLAYYDRALQAADKLLEQLGVAEREADALVLVTALSEEAVRRLIDANEASTTFSL